MRRRVSAPGPGWPGWAPPEPWCEEGHGLDHGRQGRCLCGSTLTHMRLNGLSCAMSGSSMRPGVRKVKPRRV